MNSTTSGKLTRYSSNQMLLHQLLQLLVAVGFLQLFVGNQVWAKDNGDDIIMTKGKLILRGGKGRGNLIVDTGVKSHEHHEEPMMHHFNPFPYYPMHDYHHQPMMLHQQPIAHHEQHYPQHHHQEEHHEEYQQEIAQPHYEHNQIDHQHHYQPEHYSSHGEHEMHGQVEENQERPHHMEIHETSNSEQNQYNQQEQPSQQEDTTAQQYGSQAFQSDPMVTMMMHGSGSQPTYQQLAALQLIQNPNLFAQQQQQLHLQQQQQQQQQLQQQLQQQQQLQALQELRQQQIIAQQSQQQPQKSTEKQEESKEVKKPEKPEKKRIFPSLLDSSSNSPLATIMKPLLSLNPMRFRKKEPVTQQES